MNLYDFVFRGAPQSNDVAVIDEQDRHWTYAKLQSLVSHLAGYLQQVTAEQDRCLIYSDNGLFCLCAYLACLRAGRIAVPIAPESDAALGDILRSCSPRVAFIDAHRREQLTSHAPASTVVVCNEDPDSSEAICWTEAAGVVPIEKSFVPNEAAVATILYTRHLSGEPLGVMLAHRNLAAGCQALIEHLRLSSSDRSLSTVPLSGCFGLSTSLSQLRAGGVVLLDKPPLHPTRVLQRSIEHQCTGLTSTTVAFRALLERADFNAQMLPSIRYLQLVGGKAPAGVIAALQQRFPHAAIHAMYGMAEAGGALAAVPPQLAVTKALSAGEPLPRVRLQVLDDYGHPLQPGQTGEIVAESPAIAPGILAGSGALARDLPQGAALY